MGLEEVSEEQEEVEQVIEEVVEPPKASRRPRR
jgi:hypothetical protein